MWIANIPAIVCAFIALFLSMFLKDDLRRLKGDLN